jgi:hypothetical protein
LSLLKGLHNSNCSPNIIRVIYSRKTKKYETCAKDENVYKILYGKREGNEQLKNLGVNERTVLKEVLGRTYCFFPLL